MYACMSLRFSCWSRLWWHCCFVDVDADVSQFSWAIFLALIQHSCSTPTVFRDRFESRPVSYTRRCFSLIWADFLFIHPNRFVYVSGCTAATAAIAKTTQPQWSVEYRSEIHWDHVRLQPEAHQCFAKRARISGGKKGKGKTRKK